MNSTFLVFFFLLYFSNTYEVVAGYKYNCQAHTQCIEITECGKYIEHIKKLYFTSSIHHRKFMLGPMRHIICGFKEKIPKICCPLNGKYTEIEEDKQNKRIKNRSISSPTCGNFLWEKNVALDGDPTDLYEFPWLALLEYKTPKGKRFGCGGVLISNRYVLTAAHCLYSAYQLTGVRLGEHNLKTSPDCVDEESPYCNDKFTIVGIDRKIPHENYRHLRGPDDFSSRQHDIALIRLDRPVNFTDYIQPICLPDSQPVGRDGKYLAAGWGVGPAVHQAISSVKRVFRLRAIEKRDCDKSYGRTLQLDLLCASANSSRTNCIGDFGGPLMAVDKPSRMTVVGVYSPVGTAFCQGDGVPNTYTDVRQYSHWIEQHMKD